MPRERRPTPPGTPCIDAASSDLVADQDSLDLGGAFRDAVDARLGGLAVMNAAASELLFSSLTYDLSGNITRPTQRVGGAADTWDYTYDNANRL